MGDGAFGFEVEGGTNGFDVEGGTVGGPFFLAKAVGSMLPLLGTGGLHSGSDGLEVNRCAGSIFLVFAATDVRACFGCLPLIFRGFEVEGGIRGFAVEGGTFGFEVEGGMTGGPFFLAKAAESTLRLLGMAGLYAGGDGLGVDCCLGSIFLAFAAADVLACFGCLPLIVSAMQRCQAVAAADVLDVNK